MSCAKRVKAVTGVLALAGVVLGMPASAAGASPRPDTGEQLIIELDSSGTSDVGRHDECPGKRADEPTGADPQV